MVDPNIFGDDAIHDHVQNQDAQPPQRPITPTVLISLVVGSVVLFPMAQKKCVGGDFPISRLTGPKVPN